MIRDFRITVLVDDHLERPGLQPEHGLSLWIEADDRKILFDMGQSNLYLNNARSLGIDPADADVLAISHGHYDHTGGVATGLKLQPSPIVYCHPGVFTPRYSRQSDGTMKPVGMTQLSSDALHRIIDHIRWVNGPTLLSDDIGITGPIPRTYNSDGTGGSFFLDPEGNRPDPIDDDMAMWFRTSEGITVVTGCCHAGLVNTLRHIQTLIPDEPVHTVVGGFHLLHASVERIEEIRFFLKSLGVREVVPLHCSGEAATRILATSQTNHRHTLCRDQGCRRQTRDDS